MFDHAHRGIDTQVQERFSDGPYVHLPAYDTIGQTMGGLLSLLTDLDDPKPMGVSIIVNGSRQAEET